MTLAEFLTARLDEDEQTARAAGGRWRYEQFADGPAGEPGGYSLELADENVIVDVGFMDDDVMRPVEAEHIARHDPARVLAEVEAKRRVMARHYAMGIWCAGCGNDLTHPVDQCPELRDLAAAYADHREYREEWRP